MRFRYCVESACVAVCRVTGGTSRRPGAGIPFGQGGVAVLAVGGFGNSADTVVAGILRAGGMAEITVIGMDFLDNVVVGR